MLLFISSTKRNDPWPYLSPTIKGHFCSLLISNILCNPLFLLSASCFVSFDPQTLNIIHSLRRIPFVLILGSSQMANEVFLGPSVIGLPVLNAHTKLTWSIFTFTSHIPYLRALVRWIGCSARRLLPAVVRCLLGTYCCSIYIFFLLIYLFKLSAYRFSDAHASVFHWLVPREYQTMMDWLFVLFWIFYVSIGLYLFVVSVISSASKLWLPIGYNLFLKFLSHWSVPPLSTFSIAQFLMDCNMEFYIKLTAKIYI